MHRALKKRVYKPGASFSLQFIRMQLHATEAFLYVSVDQPAACFVLCISDNGEAVKVLTGNSRCYNTI